MCQKSTYTRYYLFAFFNVDYKCRLNKLEKCPKKHDKAKYFSLIICYYLSIGIIKGVCEMEEINFIIEGDSEGKILLECPFCSSEFKLRAGEIQNEQQTISEITCPYCGLSNYFNEFLTPDLQNQVATIFKNYAI